MNRFASNGEIAEPCGLPRSRLIRVPSGRCTGAVNHRFTYSNTHGRSVCRSTALSISEWSTLSKETPTYYWYRGLSVLGNCYARSTSVAGQAAAGVGQDAPARCAGVAGGVAGRQQDVAAGGIHRCRRGRGTGGGGDGRVDRGPGAIGGRGGVVDGAGGRGRRGGGRYGDSDQGGSRCIR